MDDDGRRAGEEAVRLVMGHRTMLWACVRVLISDPGLAEQVLQDATVEILRVWDTYDRGRPFKAWARGIARRIAFATLREEARQPRLLDVDALEALAEQIDESGDERQWQLREEALV